MKNAAPKSTKILLHACCGPCSLEPVRLLMEQGYDPVIFYSNDNIGPADEYAKRLDTIQSWTEEVGIDLIEAPYESDLWLSEVADKFEASKKTPADRLERCRTCYRLRFGKTAKAAQKLGIETIGTTLSVSPYQYTAVIGQELESQAQASGLKAHFEDYRPFYPAATKRSIELKMYRQNYCGCLFSREEAEQERQERKLKRQAEKAAKQKLRQEDEAALEKKRQERQAYENRRRQQKEILRSLRASRQIDSNPQ